MQLQVLVANSSHPTAVEILKVTTTMTNPTLKYSVKSLSLFSHNHTVHICILQASISQERKQLSRCNKVQQRGHQLCFVPLSLSKINLECEVGPFLKFAHIYCSMHWGVYCIDLGCISLVHTCTPSTDQARIGLGHVYSCSIGSFN